MIAPREQKGATSKILGNQWRHEQPFCHRLTHHLQTYSENKELCGSDRFEGNPIPQPLNAPRELVDEMGFDDESVETVIDLVDQVHTLRRQLHQLGEAIGRQPAETREAIAVALKDLRER